MEQQAVIKTVGGQSPCKTCPHGEFLRIAKIVQVSAMKVHFQIAERSLFYLNPYIHLRRMTYPPKRVLFQDLYIMILFLRILMDLN